MPIVGSAYSLRTPPGALFNIATAMPVGNVEKMTPCRLLQSPLSSNEKGKWRKADE